MGSRAEGTSPRQLGMNERALGTNPRALDPLSDADLTPEELRELSYAQYRRTKHWRLLKAHIAKVKGRQCADCKRSGIPLDLHHHSYRNLGEERDDELDLLCRSCHGTRHGKRTLTVDPSGWLISQEGVRYGRILAIEIEVAEDGPWGTFKEGVVPDPSTAVSEIEIDDVEGGAGETDEIGDVAAHYVEVMKPRNPELGPEERRIIADALKVATAVECKRAIDACAASDFHMGKNERGRKYNGLSHILKGKRGKRTTREQIDFFLDMLASDQLPSGVTSEGAAKIARLKDEVRRGVGRSEAMRKLRDEYGIESEFVASNGPRPGVWRFTEAQR